MRWFRANRTFGGGLALVALALQLVLSFDHFHPEDIYGGLPLGASSVRLALSGGIPAKAQPSDQSGHHDDHYCLICATSSLLRNSVTASAPQLPLPAALHIVECAVAVAVLLLPQRRSPFQSRAPPQV
jgi:hypothetical protein